MRSSHFSGLGKASCLVNDNGLGSGESLCSGHEFSGFTDGFHVHDDGAGVLVLAEIIDEIPEIHIQSIAQRDKIGKSDVLFQGQVQDGSTESS